LTFFHEGGATAPAQFDAMDTLFRALKDGPAPVSRAEAGAYLGMLVAKGEHRRAHRLWTELFAVAGGSNPLDLRWPDAAARDYPLPFDWKLEEPTGVMLDVEQAAEGAPAMLHLVADRGSIGTLASRKILLPPGGYVLSGDTADRDSRLLRWAVTCDGSGAALLLNPREAPYSSELAFTVPPGCSVQSIALAIRDLDGRSAVDLLLPAPRLRAISRN
jgi:hypothetical protein